MLIYHHTKSENFKLIVLKEGLSFRGSYYKEFDNTDYKWAKRVAKRIIEKLCKNKKANYDPDSDFKPIITSFGEEKYSKYMWGKYADNFKGIQLILNKEKIQGAAYERLDYFEECQYMRKRNRIKKFISNKVRDMNIESDDYQYNLEAVSALIKPIRFRKEKELRYIHSYSLLFSSSFQNGKVVFKNIEPQKDNKDPERFFKFTKDTLEGIVIGYNSSLTVDEVKKHLTDNGYDLSKIQVKILSKQ